MASVPSNMFSKFVGANGILDVVVGVSSLWNGGSRLGLLNQSLVKRKTPALARRVAAWFILAIGLMRIPVALYPKNPGVLLTGSISYILEASWMLSETMVFSSTNNAIIATILYGLGYHTYKQSRKGK